MNRYKLGKIDKKEHVNMLRRTFKVEEGEVPDRNANEWIESRRGRQKKSHEIRAQEVKGGS